MVEFYGISFELKELAEFVKSAVDGVIDAWKGFGRNRNKREIDSMLGVALRVNGVKAEANIALQQYVDRLAASLERSEWATVQAKFRMAEQELSRLTAPLTNGGQAMIRTGLFPEAASLLGAFTRQKDLFHRPSESAVPSADDISDLRDMLKQSELVHEQVVKLQSEISRATHP